MAQLNTRIILRNDLLSAWETANPILRQGEAALVKLDNGGYKLKIGDGAKDFKSLPYLQIDETQLSGLIESIDNEKTRAEAAEAQIIADLTAEVIRASDAETKLTTDLAAEVTRATSVEETLQQSIDTAVKKDDIGFTYDSTNKKIILSGTKTDGSNLEINASDFIKDGMLSNVEYDSTNKKLVFIFNTDSGKTENVEVSVADLVDTYTAGTGLTLTGNQFNVDTSTIATVKALNDAIEAIPEYSLGVATTDTLGGVKSSAAENSVTVESSGIMKVNKITATGSVSTDALVNGVNTFVLDCGSAGSYL